MFKIALLFLFSGGVYSSAYIVPIELIEKLESTQLSSSMPLNIAVLQLPHAQVGQASTIGHGNDKLWPTGYVRQSVAHLLKERDSLNQSIAVIDELAIQDLAGPGKIPSGFDAQFVRLLSRRLKATHLVYFQHDFDAENNDVARTIRLFEIDNNAVIFTHRDKWSPSENILPPKIDLIVDQCVESLNAYTCDFRMTSTREGDNSLRVDGVYFMKDTWVDAPSAFQVKGLMSAPGNINMANDYVAYVSAVQSKYPALINELASISVAVAFRLNEKPYFYRCPPFLYSIIRGLP